MRISVNWVRELAPGIEGSAEELADHLSMSAVAVDEVVPVGESIADIIVARVEETRPHPNADRLGLATITTGGPERIGIVAGAPVRAGGLYPYAPPGTTLPGGLEIGARKIRGEVSQGMLCSERELELGWDHSGILELPPDLRPGERLVERLGFPDHCFVLDLTPNRVDLAGHLGVARELAPGGTSGVALPSLGMGTEPRSPVWQDGESDAAASGARVVIEDLGRCSRFLGIVIRGVTVGPSPAWLAARLWAIGGRPINNVVDATNYVMHELNQPLHAYDLAMLAGSEIRVRAAEQGERLRTLDRENRTLAPDVTVIADRDRAVGLAGVMGGEDTEVSLETTDVFLECAVFDPLHTRRTARHTGLATDASYRFERGVDATGLEAAVTRCARLITALGGGEAEGSAIRAGHLPGERPVVALRPTRVQRVLGRWFERAELARILVPLGFEPPEGDVGGEADGDGERPLRLMVPGWRGDVTHEIDLIEEVARRHGYNAFGDEARAFRVSSVADDPAWSQADRVRRLMVGRGFQEVRSASFASEARAGPDAVTLRNPISSAESRLRTDLVSGLLDRLEYNLARGRRDVRLFEIGTVFRLRAAEGVPFEELRVAFVMAGRRELEHWSIEAADIDVWDLKGLVEDLGSELLGATVEPLGSRNEEELASARLEAAARWFDGEVFQFRKETRVAGLAGRIVAEAVDGPAGMAPSWAAEFRLADVVTGATSPYVPISPYPQVNRDLAAIFPLERTVAEIDGVIRDGAPPFLEAVRLFDLYEGDEIPAASRSLAWRFRFRAPDRTLTDEEVDAGMKAIMTALEEKADARIRSS
ncbi:MAG: phenylalanine--tRNA ligase subunit beta [Gemmatimonadetes bacterium]|nr:phenylalanine--tRNA ligase subunit beta [Gemmatimonadota bacterium]